MTTCEGCRVRACVNENIDLRPKDQRCHFERRLAQPGNKLPHQALQRERCAIAPIINRTLHTRSTPARPPEQPAPNQAKIDQKRAYKKQAKQRTLERKLRRQQFQ